MEVIGAIPVGRAGDSAQGKLCEPTNLMQLHISEEQQVLMHNARIKQAFELLQAYQRHIRTVAGGSAGYAYTQTAQAEIALQEQTKPVDSWIQHQSIQSSDIEALAKAAYKYLHAGHGHYPCMQHVCLEEELSPAPPFLPTLASRFRNTANPLNAKHMSPPPAHLWTKGQGPRLPNNLFSAASTGKLVGGGQGNTRGVCKSV